MNDSREESILAWPSVHTTEEQRLQILEVHGSGSKSGWCSICRTPSPCLIYSLAAEAELSWSLRERNSSLCVDLAHQDEFHHLQLQAAKEGVNYYSNEWDKIRTQFGEYKKMHSRYIETRNQEANDLHALAGEWQRKYSDLLDKMAPPAQTSEDQDELNRLRVLSIEHVLQLRERDKEISSLRGRMERLIEQVTQLMAEREEIATRNRQAEMRGNDMAGEVAKLKRELEDAKRVIAEAVEAREALAERHREGVTGPLHGEIARLRNTLAEQASQLNLAEHRVESAEGRLEHFRASEEQWDNETIRMYQEQIEGYERIFKQMDDLYWIHRSPQKVLDHLRSTETRLERALIMLEHGGVDATFEPDDSSED